MITVIGIGNRDRGDDAAGLLVTDALRLQVPAGVTLVQLQGDPLQALDQLGESDRVVIVDALAPAGQPGRVRRMTSTDWSDAAGTCGSSTHGLGVSDVIQLGLAIGSLPEQTVVYGIEGGDFELGRGPTREVEKAIPLVVAGILEEVR